MKEKHVPTKTARKTQPITHYHVTNGRFTYAWSMSEENARARAIMDNLHARADGQKPTSKVFVCQVRDCAVLEEGK